MLEPLPLFDDGDGLLGSSSSGLDEHEISHTKIKRVTASASSANPLDHRSSTSLTSMVSDDDGIVGGNDDTFDESNNNTFDANMDELDNLPLFGNNTQGNTGNLFDRLWGFNSNNFDHLFCGGGNTSRVNTTGMMNTTTINNNDTSILPMDPKSLDDLFTQTHNQPHHHHHQQQQQQQQQQQHQTQFLPPLSLNDDCSGNNVLNNSRRASSSMSPTKKNKVRMNPLLFKSSSTTTTVSSTLLSKTVMDSPSKFITKKKNSSGIVIDRSNSSSRSTAISMATLPGSSSNCCVATATPPRPSSSKRQILDPVGSGSGSGGRPVVRRRGGSKQTSDYDHHDIFLASELKRLTIHERERITEDIHGISGVLDEDTIMIQSKLFEFDNEILKLRKRHARISTSTYTVAYEKALFINPLLVLKSEDFKLLFLRADLFDISKATHRYMLYWSVKLELFGPDKLGKQPITIQDLHDVSNTNTEKNDNNDQDHDQSDTDTDEFCLYDGGIQPLPHMDSSGRRIMMIFPKHVPLGYCLDSFRRQFYLYMCLVENDVEVQKRGVVDIFYFIGGDPSKMENVKNPPPESTRICMQLMECLPYRTAAMHALYDEMMMGPLLYLVPLVLPKSRWVRYRTHYGSFMEGSYALRSFGIPMDDIPVDKIDGKSLDNSWYTNEFLPERQKYEEEIQKPTNGSGDGDNADVGSDSVAPSAPVGSSIRVIPTGRDVLLGRGRPFQDHEGNKALAAIIEEHRYKYEEAKSTYGKKNIICEEILDIIHNQKGGRFLKQTSDGNGWELVPNEIARDKISHGFRTRKKVTNKKQMKSSSPSS